MELCTWVVMVATASLYPPEADWYPDSAADVWTPVQCGAAVTVEPDGAYHCANGHRHAGLEAELEAGGLEWQRELNERD